MRKILDTLPRRVLLEVARNFEVTGLTGKPKSEIIRTLLRTYGVSAKAVLGLFSRKVLKIICRDLGLDYKGREKQALIDRLLAGPGMPTPSGRIVPKVAKASAAEGNVLSTMKGYQSAARQEESHSAVIAATKVPENHEICNIRTAFPLIPERDLVALLGGLSPQEPIQSLIRSADGTNVFESLADWMLCRPSTCLGVSLPGLWLARDEVIQADTLPVRVGNALGRLSIKVWGDVLELSPSFLLDIRGFGEGSLRQFLGAAARVSAEAGCRQTPPKRCPTVDLFESRSFAPRLGFRTSQFKRLVDWAASEAQAITVNDLLAACAQANLPEDIALLHQALGATRLCELFPRNSTPETLETLVDDLFGVVQKRSQGIFWARISVNDRRTLDDLAGEMGITKERVRQLLVRAEERICEALATPRFVPIAWRAHRLRTMLGTAIPGNSSQLSHAAQQVTKGVSEAGRECVIDLLLWLAGP
jgi:hypothetical protein